MKILVLILVFFLKIGFILHVKMKMEDLKDSLYIQEKKKLMNSILIILMLKK